LALELAEEHTNAAQSPGVGLGLGRIILLYRRLKKDDVMK
jgi:hypothetical protein